METDKYFRVNATRPSRHAAVTDPIPILRIDEKFGGHNVNMYWKCVTKPYVDEAEPHRHTFDHYLVFLGGNPHNMLDLGGEAELTLSEDGVHQEKHIINQYTTVYIRAGLFHCPLVFTRVDRPFIFYDFVCSLTHDRF
jgi:hypothetical protein